MEKTNENGIMKIGSYLTRLSMKYMPDPSIFAVVLTFIAFLLGVFVANVSPMQMVVNWYKGFWSLLSFAMQMALIIITGSAVADAVIECFPVPVVKIGVNDKFGYSGPAVELLKKFGLCAENIIAKTKEAVKLKK